MSEIRQQTRFQAHCWFHRWYGTWATSRDRAEEQQWEHDATCVPERERWSDEVAEAWREAREIARRTPGINLRPKDLARLDEDQRLAFLHGLNQVAGAVRREG